MSRNSQYQFIPTDTETLIREMTASYEKLTGVTVQSASPEQLFIRWVTDIIIQERILNNYTGNQNIPSRAEGENLDALGDLVYLTKRPEAQSAVCVCRFYISQAQESAVLVPKGTRMTDSNKALVWETVEDVYVAIGDTYADTQIRCQTPGAIGNGYAVGQINTIVDVYDYYIKAENITASGDGADRATDDEYYELMRASMDGYSTAGPMGGYAYRAMAVSTEIADVKAVMPARRREETMDLYSREGGKFAFLGSDHLKENTIQVFPHGSETPAAKGTDWEMSYVDGLLKLSVLPGGALASADQVDIQVDEVLAGHVYLYVLMEDGTIAGEELKKAVLEACNSDSARPLTDFVQMKDPELVPYNIDLTYYIPEDTGVSSGEIEASVKQAVEEYTAWQCAKLGRDINPSELYGRLMETGIKRLELRSPVFTVLRDGRENGVPQVAALGTKTVTNGGHEDE